MSLSSNAQVNYQDCGVGSQVAIQVTCQGPNCDFLRSYPNLACNPQGSLTTNCNNNVQCSGQSNFVSQMNMVQQALGDVVTSQNATVDDETLTETHTLIGHVAAAAANPNTAAPPPNQTPNPNAPANPTDIAFLPPNGVPANGSPQPPVPNQNPSPTQPGQNPTPNAIFPPVPSVDTSPNVESPPENPTRTVLDATFVSPAPNAASPPTDVNGQPIESQPLNPPVPTETDNNGFPPLQGTDTFLPSGPEETNNFLPSGPEETNTFLPSVPDESGVPAPNPTETIIGSPASTSGGIHLPFITVSNNHTITIGNATSSRSSTARISTKPLTVTTASPKPSQITVSVNTASGATSKATKSRHRSRALFLIAMILSMFVIQAHGHPVSRMSGLINYGTIVLLTVLSLTPSGIEGANLIPFCQGTVLYAQGVWPQIKEINDLEFHLHSSSNHQ